MLKNMKRSTTDFKIIFLKKSLLKRSTNLNNQESVLRSCCVLAYSDMLSAGKYFLYEKGIENKQLRETIIKGFIDTLKANDYVFSRNLINSVVPLFGPKEKIEKEKTKIINSQKQKYLDFATRFGLSQKFVNMCFKYFFVFEDDMPDIRFDFSDCDCPLDSVILNSLNMNCTYVWSKLNLEKYVEIQDQIQEKLNFENKYEQLKNIGRMAYDFLEW